MIAILFFKKCWYLKKKDKNIEVLFKHDHVSWHVLPLTTLMLLRFLNYILQNFATVYLMAIIIFIWVSKHPRTVICVCTPAYHSACENSVKVFIQRGMNKIQKIDSPFNCLNCRFYRITRIFARLSYEIVFFALRSYNIILIFLSFRVEKKNSI